MAFDLPERRVACPTCGVPAGQLCRTPDGYRQSWAHLSRYQLTDTTPAWRTRKRRYKSRAKGVA